MAYEFDPEVELAPPAADGEGGYVVEFALGFDVARGLIVVMALMLSITDQEDALELHFGIRLRSGDGGSTAPDYTREAADTFIPRAARANVLEMVRRGIGSLLKAPRPHYVLMETYYGNLPPKALVKYEPVCAQVLDSGYVLEQTWREPGSGKDYWVFRRLAGSN